MVIALQSHAIHMHMYFHRIFRGKSSNGQTRGVMYETIHLFTASVVGDCVYVIGGMDENNSALSSVEVYDPSKGYWETIEPMPNAGRYAFGVCSLGEILYVIGGKDSTRRNTAAVLQFNCASKCWSARAAMPKACSSPAVAVLEGKIYAVGGNNPSPSDAVMVFDPLTNLWSARQAMIHERGSCGLFTADGCLYAVGGSRVTHSAEKFDPRVSRWELIAPMNTSRCGLQAISMKTEVNLFDVLISKSKQNQSDASKCGMSNCERRGRECHSVFRISSSSKCLQEEETRPNRC